MLYPEDRELVRLIRSSRVLREKLEGEKLEEFVDQATAMSLEGQKKLKEKLKKESLILESDQEKSDLAVDIFHKSSQKILEKLEHDLAHNPEADLDILRDLRKLN